MKREGTGLEPGREESMHRSQALERLEAALADADVEFPARRDELIEKAGEAPASLSEGAKGWTLKDVLTDVPVDEFSSPQHVAEVVRIRWDDMADIFRPGSIGTSENEKYGPAQSTEHTGEKLQEEVPEFDDFTHAQAAKEDRPADEDRDRHTGP